jgi:PAS domain S-box-containing protein
MRSLLVLSVLSAALPLALLLGYHMHREAELESDKAGQFVSGLADLTAANTTAALAESERVARYLAGRPLVRALDPVRCDPYLEDLLRLNRHFANLAAIDIDGNVVCQAPRETGSGRHNIGDPPWFRRLKATDTLVIGGPQHGIVTGRWAAVLAYPIRDEAGVVSGAAQVALDPDTFHPAVNAALPAGGVAALIDAEGVEVARSASPEGSNGRDMRDTDIGRAILAGSTQPIIATGNDGVERLYAFRAVGQSGWHAVVGMPTAFLFAEARDNLKKNGLIVLSIVLVAGLLVVAIHRRIVHPLADLRDTARAIGRGDRTRRAPEQGPAEVAEVASTFNRLMDLIPQLEDRLQVSEDHYRMLFEASPDAIRVVCDNRIVMVNAAALTLHGVAAAEGLVGREVLDTMHPDHRARVRERMRAVLEERRVLQADEHVLLRADGGELWIESVMLPSTYRGKPALLSIMRDLTPRRDAEARVRRLTDFRLTLSKVNTLIVREHDWHALCEAATRVAVDHGHLVSALVRMHDPATGTLKPFAGAGPRTGELGRRAIDVRASPSPPARAFRAGRPLVINEMREEKRDPQAAAEALAQGVRAAALLPLAHEGVAIGTLAVFAAEPGFFDEEFTAVLAEIAGNLAFAHAKLRAERDLAESNARLTGMVASAMDAIITVDENMRITVFNHAAEEMFGAAAAQVTGAAIDSLLPERFRAIHARWMQAFAVAGATSRSMGSPGRIAALRADGTEFPAEASISCVSVMGRTLYTVIMRDITGRIAAERSLAEAERRYRSLVENSPGGVALIEGETIEYANPGLLRMLGHDKSVDLVGRSVFEVALPAFHPRMRRNLASVAREPGRPLPPGRLRMRRADGGVIDVETVATSIDLGGRTLVQAEMRDVTRELHAMAEVHALNRSLESRIAERTRELTNANRELEAFSYSVAHDLRAPLRSMSGFAELLAMDAHDGDLAQLDRHVERIVANTGRMHRLIDGLLHVARASHVALADEPVDSAALVEEVLVELGARQRADITVTALPTVRGDGVTIRQVWANLLSNALKYSTGSARPIVTISHREEESGVVFSVADNGAGFDPAYAGKLFGVFVRLHGSNEFEGTGVGLAIVRRIVERHGGRVWADGRPGGGATFHFTLPCAPAVQG